MLDHVASVHPVKESKHKVDLEYRGTSGPVQVALSTSFQSIGELFLKTSVNLGLNDVQDPFAGCVGLRKCIA